MSRRAVLIFALTTCLGVGGAVWYLTRTELPIGPDGLRYDPIEDDLKVQQLLRAAEKEAEEELQGPRPKGWGRNFYQVKKRILKEKYGIDWRTPVELNPNIAFD